MSSVNPTTHTAKKAQHGRSGWGFQGGNGRQCTCCCVRLVLGEVASPKGRDGEPVGVRIVTGNQGQPDRTPNGYETRRRNLSQRGPIEKNGCRPPFIFPTESPFLPGPARPAGSPRTPLCPWSSCDRPLLVVEGEGAVSPTGNSEWVSCSVGRAVMTTAGSTSCRCRGT